MIKAENTNMKEPKYAIFSILSLFIYSFWGYLLPDSISYWILLLVIGNIIFMTIAQKVMVFSRSQLIIIIIIIMLIILQILMINFSIDSSTSLKVTLARSSILALGALLCTISNWYKNGIKIAMIFSTIHLTATIIAYFLPNIFSSIILNFIPNSIGNEISLIMRSGVYSGITTQVARNAFYMSVGISILYIEIITRNRKIYISKYIFMSIFLLALLLTGKRGHLIANLFAMLVTSGVYAKIRGLSSGGKVIKIGLLLSILIVILIFVFPESAAPILRFIARQNGDQTSGRIPLYINAIGLFKQRPLLGWGSGSFAFLYGIGTHNIYLQLLAENGILGFLLFSSIIVFNLSNTIKKLRLYCSSNTNDSNVYLLFSLYIQLFFIVYGITGNPLNDGFILIIYLTASSIPYTLIAERNLALKN